MAPNEGKASRGGRKRDHREDTAEDGNPSKKLKGISEEGPDTGSDTVGSDNLVGEASEQAAIPTPGPAIVDKGKTVINRQHEYDTCGYIPEIFIEKRMDSGGRDVDNAKGYFAAADLLDDTHSLTWAKDALRVDNGRKLAICVMVRVLATYFEVPAYGDRQATLPARQSLRFHALRPVDQEALEKLLYAQQSPVGHANRRSFVAGRWTSSRQSQQVTGFTKCWDSPTVCNSQTNALMNASGLRVNDIIFLEMTVRRFPPRREEGEQTQGGYWDRGWKSTFELHRIFRMLRAPSDAPIEPDSEDELEDDN